MLSTLSEWWRSHRTVWRAQKELRAARRLRNQGRSDRGLEVAIGAFAMLRPECDRGYPFAKSVLAIEAVLLDQLCCDLGESRKARTDLLRALQICEDAVKASPKRERSIRPYIDWYRQRVAAIDGCNGA